MTLRVNHIENTSGGIPRVKNHVIYVDTIADLQALPASELVDGQVVKITSTGRAGDFVIRSGTPPSDPQEGIYVALANGNYAERQYSGYVNVQWFGAVDDYDEATGEGTDSLAAFNGCRDYCKRLTGKNRTMFVPGYRYFLSDEFDLTSEALDPELSDRRQSFHVIFENRNTDFEAGTQIYGGGGVLKAVVNTSGSDGIYTENLACKRATTIGGVVGARVGLLQCRTAGAGQTEWAGDQRHKNLYIDMGSDTSFADGFGTIGYVNLGGEECGVENIQVWANTPLIHTSSKNVIKTGDTVDNADNKTIDLQQFSSKPLNTAASNTVFAYSGQGRLIAYDYVSPCILINNAATLDFGAMFLQKRETGAAGVTLGTNNWAVDCWNCFEFKHFGAVEGCKSYMMQRRAITGAEVNIVMNKDVTVPGSVREAWYLFSDGGGYIFENSDIKIRNQNAAGVIGGKRSDNSATSELQISLRNVDFKYSKNYADFPIDKRGLRKMLNGCSVKYKDLEFVIPAQGIVETFLYNKNIGARNDLAVNVIDVEFPGYQAGLGAAAIALKIEGVASQVSLGGGAAAGTGFPAVINFSASANAVRQHSAQNIFVPASITTTTGDKAVTDAAGNDLTNIVVAVTDDDANNKAVISMRPETGSGANNAVVYVNCKLTLYWMGGVNDAPLISII